MEFLIAGGIIAFLLGLGALAMLPWEMLRTVGFAGVILGMASGVPTGVWYHVELYRALVVARADRKGWIWNPVAFHRKVPRHARRRFLGWFYAGGLSFVVIVIGIVLATAGVISEARAAAG